MTTPSETTMNQMAAEDERGMLELVPAPAEPLPAENTEFPAASATTSLTATNQMAAEDERGMLERVPVPAEPLTAESPEFPAASANASLMATNQMAAEDETGMLELVPVPAEPLPAENTEFPAASATASLSARWHEILAMFVDDPRSSAEMAAGLVDDSVQALVASVREQQDSLLAAWHGENAGTEELRAAVQHYRAFGGRLADFTREI